MNFQMTRYGFRSGSRAGAVTGLLLGVFAFLPVLSRDFGNAGGFAMVGVALLFISAITTLTGAAIGGFVGSVMTILSPLISKSVRSTMTYRTIMILLCVALTTILVGLVSVLAVRIGVFITLIELQKVEANLLPYQIFLTACGGVWAFLFGRRMPNDSFSAPSQF